MSVEGFGSQCLLNSPVSFPNLEKHDASGAFLSFQILESAKVKQHDHHTNDADYRHHGDDRRDVASPEI